MKAEINQELTVVFSVVTNNALVSGLVPADFEARVTRPDGSADTVLPVAATAATNGTYQFAIPAVFLDEKGTYVATLSVDDGGLNQQVQTHFIEVQDSTTQLQASVTWRAANNLIVVNAWLEDAQGQPILNVEDCTVTLADAEGAVLEGPEVAAAPVFNGAFLVELTAPALAIGEHAAMLLVEITRVGGATYQSLTGLTFSRTS
jgi:hypothetical protein